MIRYRIAVECRWLQHLSTIPGVVEVPPFSAEASKILDDLATGFAVEDAEKVKTVERTTNHDVKAVEYVLKDKIKGCAELERVLEFVHFACTSEDINNLSHGMMLKEGVGAVLVEMDKVIAEISRCVVWFWFWFWNGGWRVAGGGAWRAMMFNKSNLNIPRVGPSPGP